MIIGVGINDTPDIERRSCFDCFHCQAAVNLWCTNENAIKDRRTSIPGVIKCPHWEPIVMKDDLSFMERVFGNYITVDLTNNPIRVQRSDDNGY